MYNHIVLQVPLKNIIHLKHESHIVLNTIVVENIVMIFAEIGR